MKSKIYLIGYSGHSYVVLDSCAKINIELYGYFEKQKLYTNPYNLDYLGQEEDYSFDHNDALLIGIGNNHIRYTIFSKLMHKNCRFKTIIDPDSSISTQATIRDGSFVGPKAIVNSRAVIHEGVIINSGSIVEHECSIGAFSHIAPGAVLCGNVKIGTGTLIGAGAIIKEGIHIGNNVTVGAGSVVLKDIDDSEVWVGNPAKKLIK